MNKFRMLLSVPHAGTVVPPELKGEGPHWLALPDTDWHVDKLAISALEGLPDRSVELIIADHSRYVVDLNRPVDDQALYPGVGTGLVPTESFAGEALYPAAAAPDLAERTRRVKAYWEPYHQRLQSSLDRISKDHGFAVLLDLHSIASRVPRLFDGRLPDLNLGTFDGRSCAPDLEQTVVGLLAAQHRFSWVVNGRFKGGYITRHYGQPTQGVHALQLEIAQSSYMDESNPRLWSAEKAEPLIALLQQLIAALQNWRPR